MRVRSTAGKSATMPVAQLTPLASAYGIDGHLITSVGGGKKVKIST